VRKYLFLQLVRVLLYNKVINLINALMLKQADDDKQVVAMWLHDKAPGTQRIYRTDVIRFLSFIGKPLSVITIGDVQAFADSLECAPATKARVLAAIKSLFGFAKRIGYVRFDVSAAVKLPRVKNTLSERILCEGDVSRMIALEPDDRNRVMLKLLYLSGMRVSELCRLAWCDVQSDGESTYITVFGKGGKTRTILLDNHIYKDLVSIRGRCGPDDPVFRSHKGGFLDPSQIWRIVRNAARRAGIDVDVSPHWFRHAHASHALERGCPIHLVQATLGHASVATTGRYLHARPKDSSARFLCAP